MKWRKFWSVKGVHAGSHPLDSPLLFRGYQLPKLYYFVNYFVKNCMKRKRNNFDPWEHAWIHQGLCPFGGLHEDKETHVLKGAHPSPDLSLLMR